MAQSDNVLNSPQAEALLHHPEKLSELKNAPETQKIFEKLRDSTGNHLEQAADQAAGGDPAPLIQAIRQLMQDPEGAALIQKMKRRLH